jgi:hypothetical protein
MGGPKLLPGWKRARLLFCLVFLLTGVGLPAAHAQSFSPPSGLVFLLLKEGRLTLSGFYTQWENPFNINLTTFNFATLETVSATVRVFADTPVSPLIEGKYELSPRWSVGFWYNPIRGERLRERVQPPNFDQPVELNFQRNTDLADLHVIYTGPRGLTAQLGYFRENGTISDRSPQPVPPQDYVLTSWNVWVTQGFKGQVRGRRIAPFVSAGYHTSSALRRPVSALVGLAVTLNDRTQLSSSVWLFDLSDRPPGTATRITAGLVYLFE